MCLVRLILAYLIREPNNSEAVASGQVTLESRQGSLKNGAARAADLLDFREKIMI